LVATGQDSAWSMVVRAGAHNKWAAGCGGASYAPGGSLEFEMSKNILKPFRPCYRGRRFSSVNSLNRAVPSFAVGVPVRPIGRKTELRHRANYASIQALASVCENFPEYAMCQALSNR
jgi:hypothetical protein